VNGQCIDFPGSGLYSRLRYCIVSAIVLFQFNKILCLLQRFYQVFTVDFFQQLDSMIFIPMLGTVLGIDILPWINPYLERAIAAFQGAIQNQIGHFGVVMVERLVLDVDIFRCDVFLNAVFGFAMLGTVLGMR
jgi:hypothetical protein